MARPLAKRKVFVAACADDVNSLEVSFVHPCFEANEVFAHSGTSDAAIENLVVSIQGLTNSFANNRSTRAKLIPQHAETSDLRFRRNAVDNTGNSRAMAVNVPALSWTDMQGVVARNDRDVVNQLHPG